MNIFFTQNSHTLKIQTISSLCAITLWYYLLLCTMQPKHSSSSRNSATNLGLFLTQCRPIPISYIGGFFRVGSWIVKYNAQNAPKRHLHSVAPLWSFLTPRGDANGGVQIINEELDHWMPKAQKSRRRGGVPSPPRERDLKEFFFDFRRRNGVFGAFWMLYFTTQLTALKNPPVQEIV